MTSRRAEDWGGALMSGVDVLSQSPTWWGMADVSLAEVLKPLSEGFSKVNSKGEDLVF